MRASSGLAVGVLAVVLGGCGSAYESGSDGGGCTPGMTAGISITSAGVSPKAVCVLLGGSVTFTNQDAVAHDVQSDATCPELAVGSIPAAQSRTATMPAAARTCAFHDAGNPSNAAFQGTVSVMAGPPPGGPGY